MQSNPVHTRGSGRTLVRICPHTVPWEYATHRWFLLTQAISAVVGCVGTLGYMWVAGKQTKAEQGPVSMYRMSLLFVASLAVHYD